MRFLWIIILVAFANCKSAKNQERHGSSNEQASKNNDTLMNKPLDFSAGPHVIIYKTRKDYNDKVPVLLNEEKTKIISYPGVKDVFYNGKLAIPTSLSDGFLLDNRGIGKNVAFLKITYEEYSKLEEPPSTSEMMNMIIDKEPLTEMYDCGNRYQYKDIPDDLNRIISNKQLNRFNKIAGE